MWVIEIWAGALNVAEASFAPGSEPFMSESVDSGTYVIQARALQGSAPGCAETVDVSSGHVAVLSFEFDLVEGCNFDLTEAEEPSSAALIGQITDGDRGMHVRLVPSAGQDSRVEDLDEDGHFAFSGLRAGTYELRVLAAGVVILRRTIILSAGEERALELTVGQSHFELPASA